MTDPIETEYVSNLFNQGSCTASPRCLRLHKQFQANLLRKYILEPSQEPTDQHILACLNLSEDTLGHVDTALKTIHKGAGGRQARKGDGLYQFREFSWNDFVSDIEDVNRSKEVRSGGEMRSTYLRPSSELLDGHEWPLGAVGVCPLHWVRSFGAFTKPPSQQDGTESLVAYVRVKRHGQIFSYSQILGHGDHLPYGVMYGLHRFIVETFVGDPSNFGNTILYNRWISGGSGLQQWKKRNGFLPSYIRYAGELESGRKLSVLRKLIPKYF